MSTAVRAATCAIAGIAVASGVVVASSAPARADRVRFTAAMTAEEEVPEPGPAGGRGTAEVIVDEAEEQLCYVLAYEGIGEPTAAHVHRGGPGTAGPVVVDFAFDENGNEACIEADRPALRSILDDPAGHYVNVHTADHPGGAIRGQLSQAPPPPS
jgi:hypothetical protein